MLQCRHCRVWFRQVALDRAQGPERGSHGGRLIHKAFSKTLKPPRLSGMTLFPWQICVCRPEFLLGKQTFNKAVRPLAIDQE